MLTFIPYISNNSYAFERPCNLQTLNTVETDKQLSSDPRSSWQKNGGNLGNLN